MIALLRAGALAVNVAVLFGGPLLGGLGPLASAAIAAAGFALVAHATARAPRGSEAPRSLRAEAHAMAARMGADAPRFVRHVDGWGAAAVRRGRGYGLLIGRAIGAHHRPAVMAHEIAHHRTGDLRWEPWTDGPARVLVSWGRTVPPLGVVALPFLLFGAPLARATELRADRLAAAEVASYPEILQEVASIVPDRPSLLYPRLAARVRASARRV